MDFFGHRIEALSSFKDAYLCLNLFLHSFRAILFNPSLPYIGEGNTLITPQFSLSINDFLFQIYDTSNEERNCVSPYHQWSRFP